jgi:serine/threonine protein kinase/tetratricopeptide (TPR) repeat protein
MTGTMISHYQILDKICDSPTGALFKARDIKLDRTVALKLLPAELSSDETAKKRFLSEARAAGSLDHPSIATVHEVNETPDGQLYVVMGWQEGHSLQARLGRGPLGIRDALGVAADVARGLVAAHAQGIVHRDVSPRSIWIGQTGGAQLVDFGVARLAGAEQLTSTGATPGSLPYMAPEQIKGAEADTHSDIWSLGVLLHECVSGRKAFGGESDVEVTTCVLTGSPEKLAEEIPAQVGHVIARCLQKDPRDRYASASEVLADLECIRQGLATGTLRGTRERRAKGRRRRVPWAAAAAGVAALAAAALGLRLGGVIGPPKERPRISVAVIPFDGSALSATDRWMADAVSDGLMTDLCQLKALRIVSRNSSSLVKASDDPREAGRKLTAQYLVSGEVSRSANTIVIEARMARCDDAAVIMESEYRSTGTNVQVLQGRISSDALAKLGEHPTRDEAKRITGKKAISDSAFELFSRGKASAGSFDQPKAIEYFSEVVRLEPDYADGWAYLARACEDAVNIYAIDWPEGRKKSREAIARAVSLDPHSSYVRMTAGYLDFMREKKWDEAETSLKEAIAQNPSNAEAYLYYANYLAAMGRSAEADAAAQEAIALDPLRLMTKDYHGLFLFFGREYDRSIAVLKDALALDPNDIAAHYWIAESYVAKGMYEQALAEYHAAAQPLAGTVFGDSLLIESYRIYGLMGQPDRAQSLANAVVSRYPPAEKWKLDDAMIYVLIAMGEKDEAFAALNRLYNRGYAGSWLLLLRVVEWLDPLRDDPRFADLLRKMDLDF